MNFRLRHLCPVILSVLLPFAGPTMAQSVWELHFDPNIPVHRQGATLPLAWAGGLNFVQVSATDLNGDGSRDLVLFDRSGNKVVTLLHIGQSGSDNYSVTRDYDHVDPLPGLHDWALWRDYDCDGKEDIFTYSQAGFAVYRNTSSGSTHSYELITQQARSNYVSPSGSSVNANLFISQIDLPGLIDVDNDGDLDVLTFSLLGSYLEYHKNLSMETYGTCDSLFFELRNKCWGFFAENASTNDVTLNVPCNFNVPNPEIGAGDEHEASASGDERAHSGSTVTPIDLDGNGVMDLLLGDISFGNLVALNNGGTTELANITSEDAAFPSYDEPVNVPIFPGAFQVDVDHDGKRDLIVSPNATSLAENFHSMHYYQNIGTDAFPVFSYQQNQLFQGAMLDFGEGAYPVAFDHDNDGLMDLVVANRGYYDPSGNYIGKLALLRNVGNDTAPAFDLLTDDYMNLSTSGIGENMYPAFGDVDGDGDLDLYIGDHFGRLHFYRNVATGPVAQFQLIQPNLTDADGLVIDAGQQATPQFHDLDGDGLQDLIVGETNGNLNYYRNTGSAQAPSWTLISESLGGVDTKEWWNNVGRSVPSMFHNTAGERQILLGSESGWLYHYGDIDGNEEGAWTLLDSAFMDLRDGMRTAVCVHDFTGDGIPDLVVGNFRGGLSFWRSELITSVRPQRSATQSLFTIVPNPASDHVEVRLSQPPARGSYWTIRNAVGQLLDQVSATDLRTVIPLGGLPASLYYIKLEGAMTLPAQRLVIIPTN